MIDWLYFCIYDFYYKGGRQKGTRNPQVRAAHVLSFTFLIWTALSIFLFFRLEFNQKIILVNWQWLAVYLLFFLPIYYFYVEKDRYQIVFDKYNDLSSQKKKRNFTIFAIIFFLPMVGVFTIAITKW